jgi:enterochelin esterase-like enzyme
MPGYVASPWVEERAGVPRGTLTDHRLASAALGETIDYTVYRPAGPAADAPLPVVYVTDGHEYRDPLMGGMVQVLDNMIAAGAIEPVMAVFVDPRTGGRNRRAEHYVLNPAFARFLAGELAPVIDAAWATVADRRARAILGTSLGGLNAAYVGAQETAAFGLVGCQSPAFQAGGGNILQRYQQAPRLPLDIVITWGAMHDFGEHTARMLEILDAKDYPCTRFVVDEGHSWGNWRGLLDDVLMVWFGAE